MSTNLQDIIPSDFDPKTCTSTYALLVVADILELHPERWFQEAWYVQVVDGDEGFAEFYLDDDTPLDSIDFDEVTLDRLLNDCGTACCVKGWGNMVRGLDPHGRQGASGYRDNFRDGTPFDISDEVADLLYSYRNVREPLIAALRWLATFTPATRLRLSEADLCLAGFSERALRGEKPLTSLND